MQLIFLLCLSTVALRTLYFAYRRRQAFRRFKLLPDGLITSSESIHHIGYSVVCSSVHSISHIEELLSVEYDHYEVIITIDSAKYPKSFERIIKHFHLVEVSHIPCEELPSASIQRLFRSAKRPLRRVVLIDRHSQSEYDDLNAATSVATYDYLIPLGAESLLHPSSFEIATSVISQKRAEGVDLELIDSPHLDNGYIFDREKLIELGGFSAHIAHEIARRNRLRLELPLCYRTPTAKTTIRRAVLPALALLLVILIAFGLMPSLALLSTFALQWASNTQIAEIIGSKKCSGWSKLYYLSRKWDFFRPRKFTVS